MYRSLSSFSSPLPAHPLLLGGERGTPPSPKTSGALAALPGCSRPKRRQGAVHPRHQSSALLVAAKVSSSPAGSQSLRSPRRENIPGGDFFVDHTCIDCDTCRWMAPATFTRVGDMSAVHQQPATERERLQALQALLSCPTASIHTRKPPADMKQAQDTFPLSVSPDLPGVYHTGFHSPKSFGATSYFVVTPGCNVLVDCPRYTDVLARKLEAMGGVDFLFLTHIDDVADHEKWAARFNCKRVMHSSDVDSSTAAVECKLQGGGPWKLPADVLGSSQTLSKCAGDSGLTIVHTPGHSAGSCTLHLSAALVPPPPAPAAAPSAGAVFTGDHLALDEDDASLTIFPQYNSFSLDLQAENVRKLSSLPFLWVLPGHGRRVKFRDEADKAHSLSSFVL